MAKFASCGKLIKQIGDELQKMADNKMRSQNMTMAQTVALLALYHTPEKQLTMKQLEKELHVAQSGDGGVISTVRRKEARIWIRMISGKVNLLHWEG